MNKNKIFTQIINISWIIGWLTLIAFGMYLTQNMGFIEEVAKEKRILELMYNFLWPYVIIWIFEIIWVFILISSIKSFIKWESF